MFRKVLHNEEQKRFLYQKIFVDSASSNSRRRRRQMSKNFPRVLIGCLQESSGQSDYFLAWCFGGGDALWRNRDAVRIFSSGKVVAPKAAEIGRTLLTDTISLKKTSWDPFPLCLSFLLLGLLLYHIFL